MATYDWYMKEIRKKAEEIIVHCNQILNMTDPASDDFIEEKDTRLSLCTKQKDYIDEDIESVRKWLLEAEDEVDE